MSTDSHELQLFYIIHLPLLKYCRSRQASIHSAQNLDLGLISGGACSAVQDPAMFSGQQALDWAADLFVCTYKGQTLRRGSSAQVGHLWICLELCQEGCTAVFSCMFNEQRAVLAELTFPSCSKWLAGLLQSCLTGPQHYKRHGLNTVGDCDPIRLHQQRSCKSGRLGLWYQGGELRGYN